MVKDTKPRAPRQKLLVVAHPDHYLEFYGEGVDVLLVRMPMAFGRQAEITAEDVFEARLPLGFRPLYDRSKLIKTASTRPLAPTTLARAIETQNAVRRLNRLAEGVAE